MILFRRLMAVLALYLSAFLISAYWFHNVWQKLPESADLFAGHLVYGILALPFSFLHTVTFYSGAAVSVFGFSFIFLIGIYWGIKIVLIQKYLKTGNVYILIGLSSIVLMSSFRWLYYGMGMMGI